MYKEEKQCRLWTYAVVAKKALFSPQFLSCFLQGISRKDQLWTVDITWVLAHEQATGRAKKSINGMCKKATPPQSPQLVYSMSPASCIPVIQT